MNSQVNALLLAAVTWLLVIFQHSVYLQWKDYTTLFKDETYKNYWARYYKLISLCKQPDKNYKTLILAYKHKENPISELAGDCLSKLKDKKNINNFIKYVNSEKDTNKLKKDLTILSKLSKEEILKKIENSNNDIKSFILNLLLEHNLDENELDILRKYLKSNSSDIKANTLKLLIKSKNVNEEDIKSIANTKDIKLQTEVIRALCIIDEERCKKEILKQIDTKDIAYWCNLLHTIKEYKLTTILEHLLANIDKTKDLTRKKGIFSLLPIYEEEKYKEYILKYWKELTANFLSLLFNIHAEKFGYLENLNLENVYKDLQKSSKNDLKTMGIPTFFNLPVYSRFIIFIIDMSGSMTKKIKNTDKTKFEAAKEELEKVLNQLGINVKFNIVLINSETDKLGNRLFSKSFANGKKEEIKNAISFLEKAWKKLNQVKRGRTDIYDALEIAINQNNVDTIILLTDGNPTWGKFTSKDKIVDEITKLNRCKFISINSVATGSTKQGMDFLKKLSQNNFGIFKEAKQEE